MSVTEIIALCHAGYNSDQIMQLARAQQMERAAQPAAPVQAAQPAAPVQAAQPADPYTSIMSELLGLKQAVQATNMMAAQQPVQPMTADDIIASIIAPKPRKED